MAHLPWSIHLRPTRLRIPCCKCDIVGTACEGLEGDIEAQSLCIQAQGWRKSRSGSGLWYCVSCRQVCFPLETSLPNEWRLYPQCVEHYWEAASKLGRDIEKEQSLDVLQAAAEYVGGILFQDVNLLQ